MSQVRFCGVVFVVGREVNGVAGELVTPGEQFYPNEFGHLSTDCLALPGVLAISLSRQSLGGNRK